MGFFRWYKTLRAVVALTGMLGLLVFTVGCEPQSPAMALLDDPVALKRGKLIYVGSCGGYCHNAGSSDVPNLMTCIGPIATSSIAFLGIFIKRWQMMVGSVLLFLSNTVAETRELLRQQS